MGEKAYNILEERGLLEGGKKVKIERVYLRIIFECVFLSKMRR